MRIKQAVVSWSGGKDGCFACYKAKAEGLEISYILNCASKKYRRSSAHGVRAALIALQAEAMGIPLYQNWVTKVKGDYEKKFKKAIRKFKKQGIKHMVTGDIHLEDARKWMQRICKETGINYLAPLWGKKPNKILEDFINAGFETIVVCARADVFSKDWLGRKVDHDFIRDLLKEKSQIDLCGERGEYHTFVINGPMFKKRLDLSFGRKVLRDGHWFLDLKART